MKFYVSRQLEYPDGDFVVEICSGGADHANPGQMGAKWKELGEGQEFTDPREAVKAALKIRDMWRTTREVLGESNEEIHISFGNTHGMTCPLPRYEIDEELLKKAEALYQSLPKCNYCGGLMGKEKYTHDLAQDENFCSQNCAENDYSHQVMDDVLHGEEPS